MKEDMGDLRERLDRAQAALKLARPWLAMIASEAGRPQTSHIHDVLRKVDAALAVAAEPIEGSGQ